MKVEKLLLQHGAAAGITVVAYQVLTGCDFSQAIALVSTYTTNLIAIVQADIWIQERQEKWHGRYERGKTGSDSAARKAG